VGGATRLPLSGKDKVRAFLIDGRAATPNERLVASYSAVSADYFAALGIKLVKGRYFTERDDDRAPLITVVNETLASRYFPGEEPLGKHLILKQSNPRIAPEIVGVVGDVKGNGLAAESKPSIYIPYLQDPSPVISVALQTDANPLGLAASARNAVRSVDKDQPIDNMVAMEELVSKSTSQQRLNMILLSIFAAIALVLAGVGIFSIMAQSVRQREQELGVRIALGAQPGQILRMVIVQGMILVLIGITLGLVATFFLGRLISSLLFGVSALDPLIYLSVPLLLAAVALFANYIPGRRATKVDPITTLRRE
jgi:predicted permease